MHGNRRRLVQSVLQQVPALQRTASNACRERVKPKLHEAGFDRERGMSIAALGAPTKGDRRVETLNLVWVQANEDGQIDRHPGEDASIMVRGRAWIWQKDTSVGVKGDAGQVREGGGGYFGWPHE